MKKNDNLLYSIQVKQLVLSFSDFKNETTVLNCLSLNVPLGKIYSLLGPSGCGKTSLIRCILGLIKPTSGTIRLFHRRLDSRNRHMLQIPGKDVGFMPQEYSLYNDLTVLETLDYHRALHNVNFCKFSVYKLIDIMDLGDQIDQLVRDLSGGQMRRLSFACALIHKPRLLILDEPTVGLDPVLRERLWTILKDYVNDRKASVLITTHYIEESRNAQIVGFMRRGIILAENEPDKLIEKFKVKTLEEVFFKLCVKQKKQSKLWKRTSSKSDANRFRKTLPLDQQIQPSDTELDLFALNEMIKEETIRRIIELEAQKRKMKLEKAQNDEKKKMIDVILKRQRPLFLIQIYYWFYQLSIVIKRIFKQTKRRKSALFAQFILPIISMLLFYFCVGETPKNIRLAIFNEESPLNLSSVFLSKLNPEIITQVPYYDLNSALASVKSGHNWGVLRISRNFSSALIERTQSQIENDEVTNSTISDSTIVLNADLTNKILVITIQRSLDLSFAKFLNETLVESLGYKSNLLSLPIRIEEVIYGSFYSFNSDNYYALKDYGLIGILTILNYTMSFGLTILVLADENGREIMERNIVIGISSFVLILSHLVVSYFKNLLNIFLLLYLTTQIFYAPIQLSSIYWAFVLLMLQSLTGLTHGMLLSAICTDFFMCAVLSNGILLIMFILSGVLWSTESLPDYLRLISLFQPTTYPVESLRCLLNRGQSINEPMVYYGFIVSLVYFLIFLIMAVIVFKRKY